MHASSPTAPSIESCLELLRQRQFPQAQHEAGVLLANCDAHERTAAKACKDIVDWRANLALGHPLDEGLDKAIAGALRLREHQPDLRLGWVCATIGYTLGMLGDFETGLDWLDLGVADAQQRDDRMQWVLTLSHQASLLAYAGEHEHAFEIFERARDLSQGEAASVRAGMISNLAYCQILRARACPPEDLRRLELAREALQFADEALADCESPMSRHWYCNSLDNRGIALGMLGRLKEAETAFEQALRQPDLSPRLRSQLMTSQAELMVATGQWTPAHERLGQIPMNTNWDLVDQTSDRVLALQIEVARHFGRSDEAQALWERRFGLMAERYRDRLRHIRRYAELRAELRQTQAAERTLQDHNSKLERLASSDALTGLSNRRGFEDTVATTLSLPAADASPTCLLLIDVDHFKSINDRFGHEAGDQVLRAVAEILRTHVRASDAVARWGGEEFVVLMPGCDAHNAASVAEKLRLQMAAHEFAVVGAVKASVGVAERLPRESFAAWLRRADTALYEAKRRGRNAVHVAGHEAAPLA